MITITPGNELIFNVEDIQVFDTSQVCPNCAAGPTINTHNDFWLQGATYANGLQDWNGYYGYAYFTCGNTCYETLAEAPLYTRYLLDPEPMAGVRFARVGDALIPLPFLDRAQAQEIKMGMSNAYLNAQRVRQAVVFLNENAPARALAGVSPFARILFVAMSGGITPEKAASQLIAHAQHTVRGMAQDMTVEQAIHTIDPALDDFGA